MLDKLVTITLFINCLKCLFSEFYAASNSWASFLLILTFQDINVAAVFITDKVPLSKLLFKNVTWYVGFVYTVSGPIYSSHWSMQFCIFTCQKLLFCSNIEAIVILYAYNIGLSSLHSKAAKQMSGSVVCLIILRPGVHIKPRIINLFLISMPG